MKKIFSGVIAFFEKKKQLLNLFAIFRVFIWFVFFISMNSCSNRDHPKKTIRIGVDPSWSSLNLYGKEKEVNAFLDEVLMEQAATNHFLFVRVNCNWDTLFDELQKGSVEAVLTALPLYKFNQAKFDFSLPILELGPRLIISKKSSLEDLKKLENPRIGILERDQSALLMLQIPNAIMHTYATVPELLNAIAREELDGGILDSLLGISYVQDLYADSLKITESSLTDQSIRLIVRKEKEQHFLLQFNKCISSKKLHPLLKKWQMI